MFVKIYRTFCKDPKCIFLLLGSSSAASGSLLLHLYFWESAAGLRPEGNLTGMQILFKYFCQEWQICYLRTREEFLFVITYNSNGKLSEDKKNIWGQEGHFGGKFFTLVQLFFTLIADLFAKTPLAEQLRCSFQTFKVWTGRFHSQGKVGVWWQRRSSNGFTTLMVHAELKERANVIDFLIRNTARRDNVVVLYFLWAGDSSAASSWHLKVLLIF